MPTILIDLILGTKEVKDREPSPTWATATGVQQIVEPSGHTQGVAPARVPQLHHCRSTVHRGFEETEMRDSKGIKILLAICPSIHRSEYFLPHPEVF